MDVLGSVSSLGIDFRNREVYFGGAYLGVGDLIQLQCDKPDVSQGDAAQVCAG